MPQTPPTLPGEQPPPCALSPARTYLVDDLSVPDLVAVTIDAAMPDRSAHSPNYPFSYLASVTTQLSAATRRSVSTHHALLVLAFEDCLSPANGYLRAALRRGIDLDVTTMPPSVGVVDEPITWSVGSMDAGGFVTSFGESPFPTALGVDVDADSQPVAWSPSDAFGVQATMSSSSVIAGILSATIQPDLASPDVAAAVARTLTLAAQEHPSCPGMGCDAPLVSDLLNAFDPNHSRVITAEGVLADGRLSGILDFFSDYDVVAIYDGAETYWPNHDGKLDSLGISYQFSASEVSVRSGL